MRKAGQANRTGEEAVNRSFFFRRINRNDAAAERFSLGIPETVASVNRTTAAPGKLFNRLAEVTIGVLFAL